MRIRFNHRKDMSTGEMMKRSIGRFSPVFLKDDSIMSKVNQYRKLFHRQSLDMDLKNGFLYFLDKSSVPFNHYMTIDNMPVDYDWVVNSSFCELIQINEKTNNDVGKSNIEMMKVIDEFISRIEKNRTYLNTRQIEMISSLRNRPAESLEEALQRILFYNQLLWQTDHMLNGLGRLDKILSRFENDCNIDEIISRFLQTLHSYYEFKSNAVLGDTGQVIILGGINPDGEYCCNEITYSIIRVLKKLRIPDPKILLRASKGMPEELLMCAVECISTGCGSPLLSNDDVVIPSLEGFGYEHFDACDYGVSACWEPLVIGKSLEQNNLCDIEFGKVFTLAYKDLRFNNCTCIDDVVELYLLYLKDHLEQLIRMIDRIKYEKDPLCTLLNHHCLQNNKDMSEGGSKYNNFGILSVGLSSVVDSLVNIEKYVFNKGEISLPELVKCLENDYADNPKIRLLFMQREDGFGSDSRASNEFTRIILDFTSAYLKGYSNRFGGHVKFGLSSPAYVNSGKDTEATADGRKCGQPFNVHISRYSSDSIVSLMNFASKLDYHGNKSNGNVVDLIVQQELFGKNIVKFYKYIKTCIKMGIFQMQFNVLSYDQLIDAKKYPEKYPNLIVRVWGFSAYFVDMPEEYQDEIIYRTKLSEGR